MKAAYLLISAFLSSKPLWAHCSNEMIESHLSQNEIRPVLHPHGLRTKISQELFEREIRGSKDDDEEVEGKLPINEEFEAFTRCTKPGLFALTFDDGPTYNGGTERVLDVLAEKRVKATFFVTGWGFDWTNLTEDVRKHELIRRMLREGHEIGSHTYSHDSLTTGRTKEDIVADINGIVFALQLIAGMTPKNLRPPFGDYNETVVKLIKEEFDNSVVTWNLDTNDWQNKEDIDASFSNYPKTMENASVFTDSFIALHHDPVVRSAELAERAIDYVRSKGFRFVTVAECVEKP